MGELTAISWTDHTHNPWWGCERVSPGCQHCYAETFAKRTGNAVWGKTTDRRRFGDKHWNEPLKWNRAAEKAGKPALVFCASMADVFEDRDDHVDDRARLWRLIEETEWLEWQLLTKRPENVRDMVPSSWLAGCWPARAWIGTTVEDQKRADERIPHLEKIPAAVRFLSCEPLLSGVDIRPWLDSQDGNQRHGDPGSGGYRDALGGRGGTRLAPPGDESGLRDQWPGDPVFGSSGGYGPIGEGRLSEGSGDDRGPEGRGAGPSGRVDGGEPTHDPSWVGAEPPQWREGRQPSLEPEADDQGGERGPRSPRAGSLSGAWGQADARPGAADPPPSGRGPGFPSGRGRTVRDQRRDGQKDRATRLVEVAPRAIDWVIVGGESGAGHRTLDIDHARFLRDQCAEAGVPFFFKQVGGQYPTSGGDLLDGVQVKQFPARAQR